MKLVFVSNFFNHHQQPLCDALSARLGGDFAFVATQPMPQERKALGYHIEMLPAYVRCAYPDGESREACERLIARADAVIVGSAPEEMVAPRIRAGKLTFRYAERPLKNGAEWGKYLPRLLRWRRRNPTNKSVYLLCASAYTAGDYARFGMFCNRAFRFGYFPEVKRYDVERLLTDKQPCALLWVGRLLDWKHPDDAVRLVRRLRDEGRPVTLDMIGTGPMEERLREMIAQAGLDDCVTLHGAMPPERVRTFMERAAIFLFTSDRREGWGAVLNEAMNSACAVVASHEIGAVPFLLEHDRNGVIYQSGNTEELCKRVCALLDDKRARETCGRAAYETMTALWNAETAAARVCTLCEALLSGQTGQGLFADGPCSAAEIVKESRVIK